MTARDASMLSSEKGPARRASTRSHRFSRSFVPGLDTLRSLGDPNREGSLAARFVSRGARVSSSCSAAALSALLLRLLAMMLRNSDATFRSSSVEGRIRLILDIVPSRNLEILNRALRQASQEI